ncbi:hypothetical protein [Variovorax sp. DAIF25]|uniref:hypothetical protein n=1 Tax=Variovorax sp. DAIF25 TaxID=3080983 RepID=UPI003D6C61EE
MLYRLYCSSGNTLGVEEYVCYSEIGADNRWVRYVEIRPDGTALRYDSEHAADRHGVLPEGEWEEEETTKREYGIVAAISADLFQAVWSVTQCVNDASGQNARKVAEGG